MCRFVQWPGLSHVDGYHLGAIVATPKVRAVAQCLHNSLSLYTTVRHAFTGLDWLHPRLVFISFLALKKKKSISSFFPSPLCSVREEVSIKHFLPV